MSAPRSAPTVLQMVLGRRLLDLRKAAGMSSQETGAQLHIAHTTVIRMEQAKVALKWATVKALLELYDVEKPEAEQFLALTVKANEPGWWQSFRDALPDWFAVHVSLENAATHIRGYEPHVVPGLLQTPDYARAVLSLNRPHPTPDELERRVTLRMKRQALVTRTDPPAPQLWAVLDETVLRRPAGEPAVMRTQIEHLVETGDLPNVTLQVMPFTAGLHAGAFGPFTLFRFPMTDFPDIVGTDTLASAAYTEEEPDVALHREVFDRMSTQAMSHRRTRKYLLDVRKELNS
ncbi:helix-turn-helix domain-containing protein [Streptomyces acidiscabies]|uniref:XRE family transcriptional regulator n=1 Tax=Streptomyces acidiscabies TaxID=42234 RepID=A0A0L0JEQ0_9ACTN|nr:helix-turn-helix transcriptional regulator [Streptomyces acidiscabies]KND23835.1 XRE family transcriptional regulator [Streptomyces acidiscabies]